MSSTAYFREDAAAALKAAAQGSATAPLIIGTSFVTHEASGKRAGSVIVYGVDERFWSFTASLRQTARRVPRRSR